MARINQGIFKHFGFCVLIILLAQAVQQRFSVRIGILFQKTVKLFKVPCGKLQQFLFFRIFFCLLFVIKGLNPLFPETVCSRQLFSFFLFLFRCHGSGIDRIILRRFYLFRHPDIRQPVHPRNIRIQQDFSPILIRRRNEGFSKPAVKHGPDMDVSESHGEAYFPFFIRPQSRYTAVFSHIQNLKGNLRAFGGLSFPIPDRHRQL